MRVTSPQVSEKLPVTAIPWTESKFHSEGEVSCLHVRIFFFFLGGGG